MEFSTLTLQERERLAYIAGETKLAKMLAEQIDMERDLEDAYEQLDQANDDLQRLEEQS